MDENLRKSLEDIKANPSSGIAYDSKMSLVQIEQIFAIDGLTLEVKDLKKNLESYSAVANKTGKRMFTLTLALRFIALLQMIITFKQMNLTEEQNVSERIIQAQKLQNTIDFCKKNSNVKESGLFDISTGKSASCIDIIQYNNSIWSKIKNLIG